MKELIYQEKGEYIFWKINDEYSILFLKNKKRKKQKEHKLTTSERDQYYEDGTNYIKILVENHL